MLKLPPSLEHVLSMYLDSLYFFELKAVSNRLKQLKQCLRYVKWDVFLYRNIL